MIGAGSTVVKDVPDYALVVGVPARRIGWVGPAGHRLQQTTSGVWQCPVTMQKFTEVSPDEIREVKEK
jgi:serine acetyltransferase